MLCLVEWNVNTVICELYSLVSWIVGLGWIVDKEEYILSRIC